MKTGRKTLSLLLALVLVAAMFSGMLTASADGGYQAEFVVTRNGNNLDVKLVAKEAIKVGALGVFYSPETADAVSVKNADTNMTEISTVIGTPSVNDAYEADRGLFGVTGQGDFAEGETIFSMRYALKEDFQMSHDYTFTFEFDEAVEYGGGADLDFIYQTLTATYREDPQIVTHAVNFISNGENVGSFTVNDGEKVAEIAAPAREGYTFVEWQKDGAAYDFNQPVTDVLTLVAKWTKNASGETSNTVDLSDVTISKTVSSSAAVTAQTFTFNVEFDAAKSKVSLPEGKTAPNLGPLTINTADSGSVNLGDEVEFPYGGVYVYKISEAAGNADGWTYDDSVYYLVITIQEKDDGSLDATHVKIYNEDLSSKENQSLDFTNTYNNNASLVVTKEVVAAKDAPAYDKEFNFTLTLTAPEVYDTSKSVTVKIGDETKTLTYGTPFEFTLKDGDELEFNNVAEGATYTLTESGAEYYTGEVNVISGTAATTTQGEYAKDLTVSNVAIVSGTNEADFTNTYSITPDTGVHVSGEMIVIALLAVLALGGSMVVSSKLKKARQ